MRLIKVACFHPTENKFNILFWNEDHLENFYSEYPVNRFILNKSIPGFYVLVPNLLCARLVMYHLVHWYRKANQNRYFQFKFQIYIWFKLDRNMLSPIQIEYGFQFQTRQKEKPCVWYSSDAKVPNDGSLFSLKALFDFEYTILSRNDAKKSVKRIIFHLDRKRAENRFVMHL